MSLQSTLLCNVRLSGQPNQISYTQWQRSPLAARWDISKAQNMVFRHTGLSITILKLVVVFKGMIFTLGCTLFRVSGFYRLLGLHIDSFFHPSFAYPHVNFSLSWKIPLFFVCFFFSFNTSQHYHYHNFLHSLLQQHKFPYILFELHWDHSRVN